MTHKDRAELYLDGVRVGEVVCKSSDHAWHFGEFTPDPEFAPFATLFGQWSLLMHADEDSDRLTDAASEELRAMEIAIDRIHARLRMIDTGEWREIQQLNIDGDMIDWKE
jgi:hypothetical protein